MPRDVAAAATEKKPRSRLAAARENVEAIVAAVCVALLIRTFAAEPYSIPTGSMAPTLLGAHRDVVCPTCSLEFDAAAPHAAGDLAGQVTCPGCGIVGAAGTSCASCGHPLPRGGRIALPEPDGCTRCGGPLGDAEQGGAGGDKILVDKVSYRFRDPRRWEVAVFRRPGATAINFIKRVAGLPGEEIDIIGGDIVANGAIARKSPDVQRSLWHPVHTTAASLPGWEGWRLPEAGWKDGEAGRLDGAGVDYGVQAFLDRMITDRQAYNALRGDDGEHVVGDLRLRTETEIFAGNALLILRRNGEEMRARLEATGNLRLEIADRSEETGVAVEPGRAVRWGCQLLDGEASAWIEDGPTLRLAWGPGPSEVRSSGVGIGAADGEVRFLRLDVDRDVHYFPAEGARLSFPLRVGEGEYLLLGDNAPSSKDSRYLGLVPADNFVGRAFAVFWPVAPWSVRRIP